MPAGEADEVWWRLHTEPAQFQGGTLQLFHKPGLGLELDEASLRRHPAWRRRR